jgi:hypothetical protein
MAAAPVAPHSGCTARRAFYRTAEIQEADSGRRIFISLIRLTKVMGAPPFSWFFAERVGGNALDRKRCCRLHLGLSRMATLPWTWIGTAKSGALSLLNVAGSDGEAAFIVDGVLNGDGGSDLALAVAVKQVGISVVAGAGYV